jgi:phage terminase large subunit-like protein
MARISKLEGLKRKAKREGWSQFIRTPVDEKALLRGCTFSFQAYDHFRFFLENFLTLSKGKWAGEAFTILPYQEIIFGSLFGWIREDNTRRFRRGYIEVSKKNGKTTLASAIGLYMLVADGEPAPEVYNVAGDRDQAALLWNLAADMVEASPKLLEKIKVIRSTKRMVIGNNAWFAAWSSDQSSKDGPNAHCILVDELHAWKGESSREMWRKIRYAGIARAQPLCPLVITTAGDDKFSLCYEQHQYAQRVINDAGIEDLAFFGMIFGANPERIREEPEYWRTEEAWKESNPAYNIILKKEDFEADCQEVEKDPRAKAAFLRYRLNYWIETDTPWLAPGVWKKNAGPGFKEEDLHGRICFTGVDLSSVEDFTAVVHVFPYPPKEEGEGRTYKLLPRIYIPEDTLSERIKKLDVDLHTWMQQGFIRLTPGNCIDHEFIFEEIKADTKLFRIKEIGYDRWSAAWIVLQLQKQFPNIELTPINQSMRGMSNATKAFTMALIQERIEHNNNPVLEWMAGNATPAFDSNENMMLHKTKSKDKIDAIIGSIIGFGQAELGELEIKSKPNIYSDEKFLHAMKELEGYQEKKEES